MERHLNKENSIFAELTVKEHGIFAYPWLLPPESLFRVGPAFFPPERNWPVSILGGSTTSPGCQVGKGKEPATSGGTGEESPEDKGNRRRESPAGKEATMKNPRPVLLAAEKGREPAGEEGQTIEKRRADVEEESGTAGGEKKRGRC